MKMDKIKVIKRTNMPAKLPTINTVVIIMALDYWNAPEWMWGALLFLLAILWIASIVRMAISVSIDVFKTKA